MTSVAGETKVGDFAEVIRIDKEQLKGHVAEVVRQSVEETLNGLLEAEADAICGAKRYERDPERLDTRAGHYTRKLLTQAGEVELQVPRLRKLPLETQIIEVGDLDNVIGVSQNNSSQSLEVTLDDTDGSIKAIFDTHDVHKRTARVYQHFTGLDLSDKFLLFSGKVSSPITWSERDRTVKFSILSQLEDKEIGFSAEGLGDLKLPDYGFRPGALPEAGGLGLSGARTWYSSGRRWRRMVSLRSLRSSGIWVG